MSDAQASGTINFSNIPLIGDVRIYEPDGVTGLSGNRSYLVDMIVSGATSLIDENTKEELKPFHFFKHTQNAGLFAGTIVVINGYNYQSDLHVPITVRAWDSSTGATYELSTIRGSYTFNQTALGSPPGLPPTIFPPVFTGFKGFSISATPEPSTGELCLFVLAGMVIYLPFLGKKQLAEERNVR